MRLLVFSDIHNNAAALQELRRRESNTYDALVVAGDVGCVIDRLFLDVADSFDCPTFLVHGNWDAGKEYETRPSARTVLLHHQIEQHGGMYFTGFSGHSIAWGKNPIYLDAVSEIEQRHEKVRRQLEEVRSARARLTEELETEFRLRGQRLLVSSKRAERSPAAHGTARAKLRAWRDRKVAGIHAPETRFKNTTAYKCYQAELDECAAHADRANRAMMIQVALQADVPPDRLIVVAHERQHRFYEADFVPFLHIYGHRHRYECTHFRGTHYLNAAPLDSSLTLGPTGLTTKPGRYCRVRITGRELEVEQVEHLTLRSEPETLAGRAAN